MGMGAIGERPSCREREIHTVEASRKKLAGVLATEKKKRRLGASLLLEEF